MKKLLCVLLAVVMVCGILLTGCQSREKLREEKKKGVVYGEITEKLIAEKIGNIAKDSFMTYRGGLIYKDDESGKYGVMSTEGRHDTGPIYTRCVGDSLYFEVSFTEGAKNFSDISGMNSLGLVNGKGEVLVPMQYAYIYTINQRFVVACEAEEQVFSEDETTFTLSELYFTFEFDDPVSYAGRWYVYDVTTGEKVEGATGTGKYAAIAYGDTIKIKTEDGSWVAVDASGKLLPEGADVFEDGSYAVDGTVYSPEGEKLFTYDEEGYCPDSYQYGYYVADKYENGTTYSVVMNEKGETVSSEFSDDIEIYGELIHCANKLYDFGGKQIIDGEYPMVYHETLYGNCWLLREEDDTYTMILADGSILYKDVYGGKVMVFSDDFVAHEQNGATDWTYYCHADKDYTIPGYSFAPWLVRTDNPTNEQLLYDVVDTITGNKLLEGYESYSYSETDGTALYVYAKYDGGTDVYLIVNEEQLAALKQKKTDLLNELIAAFNAEGIEVSVDLESGEMALDSSVLFGGDSAELTDAGKAFLNKFIKVYTEVAFSDKYDGFISKTMVEGHTAPVSGATYESGMPLSVERATNVRDYCLSAQTGVDVSNIAETLEPVGYSNSKPIYNSNGEVNMSACRRVSFRFMMSVEF